MESKAVFAITGIAILCILAYVLITAETPEQPPIKTTTTQPEETSIEALSDIQIEACNAADAGGTCYTKLQELGIVTPGECCKHLGKCCPLI